VSNSSFSSAEIFNWSQKIFLFEKRNKKEFSAVNDAGIIMHKLALKPDCFVIVEEKNYISHQKSFSRHKNLYKKVKINCYFE